MAAKKKKKARKLSKAEEELIRRQQGLGGTLFIDSSTGQPLGLDALTGFGVNTQPPAQGPPSPQATFAPPANPPAVPFTPLQEALSPANIGQQVRTATDEAFATALTPRVNTDMNILLDDVGRSLGAVQEAVGPAFGRVAQSIGSHLDPARPADERLGPQFNEAFNSAVQKTISGFGNKGQQLWDFVRYNPLAKEEGPTTTPAGNTKETPLVSHEPAIFPMTQLRAQIEQLGYDTSEMTELEVREFANDPRISSQLGINSFAPGPTISPGAAFGGNAPPAREVAGEFGPESRQGILGTFDEAANTQLDDLRGRAENDRNDKINAFLQGGAQGALAGLRPGSGGVGAVLAGLGAGGLGAVQRLDKEERQRLDQIGMLEGQIARDRLQLDVALRQQAQEIEIINVQMAQQRDNLIAQMEAEGDRFALSVEMHEIDTPYGSIRWERQPDGTIQKKHIPDPYKINQLVEENQARMALADAQLAELNWVDFESNKGLMRYLQMLGPESVLRFHLGQMTVNNTLAPAAYFSEQARSWIKENYPDKYELYELAGVQDPEQQSEIEKEFIFQFMQWAPLDAIMEKIPDNQKQGLGLAAQYGMLGLE